MNTPATEYLIDAIERKLKEGHDAQPRLLNIGAGMNLLVEDQLTTRGCTFECDRVDLDNCKVEHPSIRDCYNCSVESMDIVESDRYDLAFSNYLLEHVPDLHAAASEISRVLKPGAIYVTSVPNPAALEYQVSKRTPLWFHKMVRGGTGWETHYSYKNIEDLNAIFGGAGFETAEVVRYPCISVYTERFPIISLLGNLYDSCTGALKIKGLMGNVCIIYRKKA